MSVEKTGYLGLTPSKVIRTSKVEDRHGSPVVRRIRKRLDGSTFPTTERITALGILVRNSEGETKQFDKERLRKDIESCYGKIHMYDEDVTVICDKVVVEMVFSYKQVGREKVVSTKIVEEAVLTAMGEMSIPPVIRGRYMATYCINSLPKEELEELINSIPGLKP
jgi:transcriptional regulator NrdR family protein